MDSRSPGSPSVAPKPADRASLRWIFVVVFGCVAAVALLLLGIGFVLPNRWNVTREVLVHAPTDAIYPLVDDWHAWQSWAKDPGDDPTLHYDYSGPTRGVGAKRMYKGRYAGEGSSEIVRSDPDLGVAFTSNVRSTSPNAHGAISFQTKGGSTTVTWNDQGTIQSVFGVFLRANVEDELGKYMDKALARLKDAAETGKPAPAN
jgi:hypothetical protein